MRFAIIGSRGYPSTYGGYETFIRTLVPHALGLGHNVLVYCRSAPTGARSWEVGGAECRRTRGLDGKRLSTLSYGLSSCLDARRRDLDAALVVNCANGYWLPLLRSAGIPVALNVDGVEWERGKWNGLGRAVFKGGAAAAVRHADRLISDSAAIADVWERRFGTRPTYIPYGAEVIRDDADDELRRLGIDPQSYVLSVARLVPENNLELVLQAVEALDPETRPRHVIVGSGDPGDRLVREVRALDRTRGHVHWLGHVDDQRLLRQLYRHSLVYVHGHSVGGTNPALLEALGAGAPVLAYDVVFNREVIGDEDVYFDSVVELTVALRRLMRSDRLRARLSDRGQAVVGDRYDPARVSRRYLELLAELAG
jgi:glycosyltransferase involved in cell wall biosynthesis